MMPDTTRTVLDEGTRGALCFRTDATHLFGPGAIMRVLNTSSMRSEDSAAVAWGLPALVLMERAALACVHEILSRWPRTAPVLCLCGPGHNGGDGMAIARLLSQRGVPTTALLTTNPDNLPPAAALQWALLDALNDVDRVRVSDLDDDAILRHLDDHPIWVDAILGIGVDSELRGTVARLLALASRSRESRRRPTAGVLAVDIPSGVDTDTAQIWGDTLRADVTISFHAAHVGHLLPPGLAYTGELRVADIGIPSHVHTPDAPTIFTLDDARRLHQPLAVDGHKATNGRAWIRAGSDAMPGSATLSVSACLRAGAGYVHLVSEAAARTLALTHRPEIITHVPSRTLISKHAATIDALLIGPGLEITPSHDAIEDAANLPPNVAIILDADALTAVATGGLSSTWALRAHPRVVLTPHPGELGRLIGRSTADVMRDLPRATLTAAERWNAVVMTRTAGTIIATPSRIVRYVQAGSPGLATAGTGDVLVGLLTGLLARMRARKASEASSHTDAQVMDELAEVCAYAAWIHAEASRRARQPAISLTALDVADRLSDAFAYASAHPAPGI